MRFKRVDMQLWLFLFAVSCCFVHGSQDGRGKGNHNVQQQPWIHEVRRAPRPYMDPSTGHTRFERFYERKNTRTGTYTTFNSSSVLRGDEFISFDTIPGVRTLTCSNQHVLRVRMDNANDTASLYRLINQHQLVYASLEWGCINDLGYEAPLFRNVTAEPEISPDGKSLTFRTEPASPFAFFGRSRVSFFTNEPISDPSQLRSLMDAIAKDTDDKSSSGTDSGETIRTTGGGAEDVQLRENGNYGEFPGTEDEWGYGMYLELLNWNYDSSSDTAKEPTMYAAGSAEEFDDGFRASCEDCYVHAGAGIGFEFETEQFYYVAPTYLMYLKIWVTAEAGYSLNVNIETNEDFSTSSQTYNYLFQTGERNVDYRSSAFDASGVNDLLARDLVFVVAGMQVNINFRLPVFLQWGMEANGAGTLFAGSYYEASSTYGIAWVNEAYKSECVMEGCIAIRDTCSGWCTVKEGNVKSGGTGPGWSFEGARGTAFVALTPILVVRVWGGMLTGMIQMDVAANIEASMGSESAGERRHGPYPHLVVEAPHTRSGSHVGAWVAQSTNQRSNEEDSTCMSVSFNVDLQVFVWLRMQYEATFLVVLSYTLSLQSPALEIYATGSEAREIFPTTCFSLEMLRTGQVPLISSKTVSSETSTNLLLGRLGSVFVPKGAAGASMEVKAMAIPDVSSVMTASEMETYKPITSLFELTPHGTTFNNDFVVEIFVDDSRWKTDSDTSDPVATCERLSVLKKQDDSTESWEVLDPSTYSCADFPRIRISTSAFSFYGIGAGELDIELLPPRVVTGFEDDDVTINSTISANGLSDTTCLLDKSCDPPVMKCFEGVPQGGSLEAEVLGVNVSVGTLASGSGDGRFHQCAILVDGTLKCWPTVKAFLDLAAAPTASWASGLGQHGLGHSSEVMGDWNGRWESPSRRFLIPPISLGTNRTAQAVSIGHRVTCALLDTGQVKCFGSCRSEILEQVHHNCSSDDRYIIGSDEADMGDALPALEFGASVQSLSIGPIHACVVLETGAVKCWGDCSAFCRQQQGGCVNCPIDPSWRGINVAPSADSPAIDLDGQPAQAVACGTRTTDVLLRNGSVLHLAPYEQESDRLHMVDFGASRKAVAIYAGGLPDTGTALLEDGTVASFWVLRGTQVTYHDFGIDSRVVSVAAGQGHVCALFNNRILKCSGSWPYQSIQAVDSVVDYESIPAVDTGTCLCTQCNDGFYGRCTATTNPQCKPCSAACSSTSYLVKACTTSEDTKCARCTTCSATQYLQTPCSATADAVCVSCAARAADIGADGGGSGRFLRGCGRGDEGAETQCTECNSGQYQTVACSALADAECADCAALSCPPNQTRGGCGNAVCPRCSQGTDPSAPKDEASLHSSAGECLSCTQCSPGEFQVSPCSVEQDVQCRPCTPCRNDIMYGTVPCFNPASPFERGTDRQCTDCKRCSGDEYETAPCFNPASPFEPGTDRQCKRCPDKSDPQNTTCPPTQWWTGCGNGEHGSCVDRRPVPQCPAWTYWLWEVVPSTFDQGSGGCEPCPGDTTSLPGALSIDDCVCPEELLKDYRAGSDYILCVTPVKVTMTVEIQGDVASFNQDLFAQAVAQAAGVAQDRVSIDKVEQVSERRADGKLRVQFSVATESVQAAQEVTQSLTTESLDQAIKAAGLDYVIEVTENAEVVSEVDSDSESWISGVSNGIVLGVAIGGGVLLLFCFGFAVWSCKRAPKAPKNETAGVPPSEAKLELESGAPAVQASATLAHPVESPQQGGRPPTAQQQAVVISNQNSQPNMPIPGQIFPNQSFNQNPSFQPPFPQQGQFMGNQPAQLYAGTPGFYGNFYGNFR